MFWLLQSCQAWQPKSGLGLPVAGVVIAAPATPHASWSAGCSACGGECRIDNGLLLRSDVHTLFDRRYLGVDPKHRLLVSPRLREEFGNGEQFYARVGERIAVPERPIERPNREFLEWHLEEVFKAA